MRYAADYSAVRLIIGTVIGLRLPLNARLSSSRSSEVRIGQRGFAYCETARDQIREAVYLAWLGVQLGELELSAVSSRGRNGPNIETRMAVPVDQTPFAEHLDQEI